MPCTGRTSPRGVTLVEMLVALALASFLLGGGAVALESLVPRWRLQAATSEVAWALLAARSRAAVTNAEVAVVFESATGRYGLTRAPSGSTASAPPPMARLPPGVRFVAPLAARPITLSPPGSSAEAALFTPQGRLLAPTIPGYVNLGDSSRGLYRRVVVSSVGRVTTETWVDQRWVAR